MAIDAQKALEELYKVSWYSHPHLQHSPYEYSWGLGETSPEIGKWVPEWIKNPFAALLYGPPGRGKTHTAAALIHSYITDGGNPSSCAYISAVELEKRISEEVSNKKFSHYFIEQLIRSFKLLIIDDLGSERQSDFIERSLCHLFNGRIGLITIITTNWNRSDIIDIYGPRIESRLRCYADIEFGGPDLRHPPIDIHKLISGAT